MCLVAHTALKILHTCLWYSDSGYSKHMTGDKTLLKEVQMGKGGRMTYGDGSQSKIIGKRDHRHSRTWSISGSVVCGRAQGKSS
jgi:hypothetical protein